MLMIRFLLMLLMVGLTLFFPLTPSFAVESETPITAEQLQWGETIAQKAIESTEKGDFPQAERYWTQLIESFPTNPAVWSNRGNSKVSQLKLEEALLDFNQAISLVPSAPDPYLNRGTALEGLGRYEEAIADYDTVLSLNPQDAMAYNNRGNAKGGLGKWQEALEDYQKAVNLAPNFAFAQANAALALYEMGEKGQAITKMRNLTRKYPMFPDMRAALTAALWEQGNQGEAESHWVAAVGMDTRYQELEWVKEIRRWPPSMVAALDKFLNLK